MKENIREFLEYINQDIGKVVFKLFTNDNKIYQVPYNKAIENTTNNVYFVGNIDIDATQTLDSNIGVSTYIRVDIDILKQYKDYTGEDISHEDLLCVITTLKCTLDEHKILGTYSYIVCSGRGVHIYYVNSIGLDMSSLDYKDAIKIVYDKIDDYLQIDYLRTDKATCNKARLMRLPGSVNQKNKESCQILFSQPQQSPVFGLLPDMVKQRNVDREIKLAELELEQSKVIYNTTTDDFYKSILEIPAFLIAQELIPQFKLARNKKNFDNGKSGYTGYFYVVDKNIIINGGSQYFNWGGPDSGFNPFLLIKNWYGFTNYQTFDYFKRLLEANR